MFSDTDESVPPHWKELGEECDVLEDRIRFKTTHFSFFTVIVRYLPPTASVEVDPSVVNQVHLTVPELPGFDVKIPSKSVQSATEIKATLFFDDSEVFKEDSSRHPWATACILLEPHGLKFTEKIAVQIPIPGYSEITTKSNPNAKLQLLYSPTGSTADWVMQEDDVKVEKIGEDFVAKFFVNHFSSQKIVWSEVVHGIVDTIGNIFKRVKSLGGRCQAFMTDLESTKSFQVVVYPFRDCPLSPPDGYHSLLDSGNYPIEIAPGELHYEIKMDGQVLSERSIRFSGKFQARADFTIIGSKSVPDEGRMAQLSVLCHDDTKIKHEFDLIKVVTLYYDHVWLLIYAIFHAATS